MSTKQVIEINGVKLEVDMRYAKRIEELQIGSRVKCLVKEYSDTAVYPGVIVGFDAFPSKPTINVCYMKTNYSGCDLVFKAVNVDTKDFEIVGDVDNNALDVDKSHTLKVFDRELQTKQSELDAIKAKRAFFEEKFAIYFTDFMAKVAA
jgi:hypothetical protein